MGKQTLSGPVHTVWWHLHKGFIFCTFMFRFRRAVDLNTIIWASMLALHIHIRVMIAVIQKWWLQCIVTTSIGILISSNEGPKAPLSFPSLPSPILYFIVYITVCRGWVGVCVMYTIENHHLHSPTPTPPVATPPPTITAWDLHYYLQYDGNGWGGPSKNAPIMSGIKF